MRKPVFLIIVCLLLSCSHGLMNMSFEGDTAEIELSTGSKINAELLMVSDLGLYVRPVRAVSKASSVHSGKIYRIPYADIRKISIEGYVNHGWQPAVIIFQFIPAILFTIAAASADAELTAGGFLILYGIPVFTYVLFAGSEPDPPGFAGQITEDQLAELRKYTRYPDGLSDAQFSLLLKKYGQDTVILF